MTTIPQLLADSDTFATTLFMILVDAFGYEPLGDAQEEPWTQETVAYELKMEYGVAMPQGNVDKLMAAIVLVTTDKFYCELQSFIWICNVLADDEFTPGVFDPADAREMAWGITEAAFLWPPDQDEPFSDEIRGYIGFVVNQEGIVDPPDVLRLGILPQGLADPLDVVSDDPEMYAAFYANKQSRSQEITDLLRSQLAALFGQLEALPLRNGSTQALLSRLQAGVA